MDARIGYWIALVGSSLTIIGWFLSMAVILFAIVFSPLTLLGTGMVKLFGGVQWGVVFFYIASALGQLLMLVLQLVLALKIRERAEWARFALTAVTLLSILYGGILTAMDLESGGAGVVVAAIISLVLVGIFWLPQANAWFVAPADDVPAPRSGAAKAE